MSTITPLPDAPQRGSATFAADAQTFLDALPDFVTEANVVAGEVNDDAAHAEAMRDDAVDAADIALASANFYGNWSSLTGALNIPASARHADAIWMLVGNLADVTAAEPGVHASWVKINELRVPSYTEYLATPGSPWSKPFGCRWVYVEAIGGGGGGGNQTGTTNTGGGGGGAFNAKMFNAADLASTVAIAIGAGGAGGATGSATAGTDGGDTTFGSTLLVAPGGKGATATAGGAGGDGSLPGGTSARPVGGYSSTGGGLGGTASASPLHCIKGGAGGGGSGTTAQSGGTSTDGGAGGAGIATASTKGGDGTAPGGAGGGSTNNGGGGDGAAGRMRIWAW